MNSIVFLYYNSHIIPEKNFKIDDLEQYLATLEKLEYDDFQYIKHDLSITIKVNLSQEQLAYNNPNSIDYVRIQNGLNVPYFYFVKNRRWISSNTIALDLYIDSIITFEGNYTLSDKSRIYRKHSDRWVRTIVDSAVWNTSSTIQDGTLYGYVNLYHNFAPLSFINNFSIDVNGYSSTDYQITDVLIGTAFVQCRLRFSVDQIGADVDITMTAYRTTTRRKIDLYSEGISPLLYKKLEYTINDDGLVWNLIYRKTGNENQAVECSLLPSESINVNYPQGEDLTQALYGSVGANNYAYWDYRFSNSIWPLEVSDGTITTELRSNRIDRWIYYEIIGYTIKYLTSTTFKVYKWSRRYNSNGTFITQVYLGLVKDILGNTTFTQIRCSENIFRFAILTAKGTAESSTDSITLITTTLTIKSFDALDKTDPLLIKIIELPYSPIPYTLNKETNEYSFNINIQLNSNSEIKIPFNNFENTINSQLTTPYSYLVRAIIPSYSQERDDIYESKLYHSDYYLPKFVYDSFSHDFIGEFQSDSVDVSLFKFKFKTSNTINSRFLFDFYQEDYKLSNNDYPNILNVERNNEKLILNDDYINYIKNGYNYDIKMKKMADIGAIAGGISGTIGGALTIAGGVASSNPALVIGGIASIGSAIVGSVNNIAKSELAMSERLLQKKMQSLGIEGANDIDLLNYYTKGNKAKLCYYEVSDRMKKALADLFYYTGYNTDEFGNPQDYMNTRIYFNYIQADVLFKENANISDVFMNDIKARFMIGITCIHHTNGEWDLEQHYENWERTIIE